MLAGGDLRLDARAGCVVRANAFQDAPGLVELLRSVDGLVDLVAPGEGSAVKKMIR